MKTSVTLYSPEGEDPFANFTTRSRAEKVQRLVRLLKAIAGGGILTRSASRPSLVAGTAYATGTVTCAAAAAADTVTLNGQNFTAVSGAPSADQFDVSGADAADATSLASAINISAQSLVAGLLRAGNLAGTVTCASVAAGDTVTLAGVTLRAVAAASGKPDEFSVSGTDSQDATALANAINAHPVLRELVLASASSAVVTVRQLPFGSTTALVLTSSNGTRLAVVAIAATAVVLVVAAGKGKGGNTNTLASSNGTRLAVSGARLAGGTDATTISF